MKTSKNLSDAFSGESKANRRYLAFARKAEEEGFPNIARLFRAAAEAETVHALNHLKIMGGVKTTKENLEAAISGETFEFKQMYPEYLIVAEEEGNNEAFWSFNVANKVEQVHARLYQRALEAIGKNRDLGVEKYYVCSVCGNTVENEPPEKCPICGAPSTEFKMIK